MDYCRHKRLREAEKLILQVLENSDHVTNRARTLRIMRSVGCSYAVQGQWEEAERLLTRIYRQMKKAPERWVNVIPMREALALSCMSLGKWKKAVGLLDLLISLVQVDFKDE